LSARPQPLVHPRDYHQEAWHSRYGSVLRDAVFGVNDGLVSMLGIVAGITASRLDHRHVIITALVAVIAATVSMALGSYISTRSENDFNASEVERERREIEEMPEHEMEEIEEIYAGYGFSPEEIAIFQRRFAQNHDLWLEFMLRDELGILRESQDNPWKNAGVMALAVMLGSVPPVLPYLIMSSSRSALELAFVLSGLAAFLLGVMKSLVAKGSWWGSGLQFLVVAGVAAAIGIGAGDLLPSVFRAVGG